MARDYGEGFGRAIDPKTGGTVPGTPRVGVPSTNSAIGNGYVILTPDSTDDSIPKGDDDVRGGTRG